jgi:hypothetical protein
MRGPKGYSAGGLRFSAAAVNGTRSLSRRSSNSPGFKSVPPGKRTMSVKLAFKQCSRGMGSPVTPSLLSGEVDLGGGFLRKADP